METTLNETQLEDVYKNLAKVNGYHRESHPGETGKRQPVHTVYGGAHLFKSSTAEKMGELALNGFYHYAPNALSFQKALGINGSKEFAAIVYERVQNKLSSEAVEDFRIDFEDGFGNRPDEEEDQWAVQAATEVAKGMAADSLPPFIGIRIKPLTEDLKRRSLRTLDLFVSTLVNHTGGKLPNNFVVTLPKITSVDQVEALVDVFELLEDSTSMDENSLKMEFMIEVPESLFDHKGRCSMPRFIHAAKGRCVAAHYGTYDFTASVSVTAEFQTMDHQVCDFARNMMKAAFSGTGIWVSDGATNVMPVGPHKGPKSGSKEEKENFKVVHSAWKLSYSHVRHSLENGFYTGWDLHPLQLPVRYGALYSFFLEGLDAATVRLKNFMEQAAKATLVGDIFDDAATGQGLLNYFIRALNCGAISLNEIQATGLTIEEIQTRSFYRICQGRRSSCS